MNLNVILDLFPQSVGHEFSENTVLSSSQKLETESFQIESLVDFISFDTVLYSIFDAVDAHVWDRNNKYGF